MDCFDRIEVFVQQRIEDLGKNRAKLNIEPIEKKQPLFENRFTASTQTEQICRSYDCLYHKIVQKKNVPDGCGG